MDKFTAVLRTIVFFLFPTPFLLGFALSHEDWTAYVAYAAIAVLASAAVAPAWAAAKK